MRTIGLAALGAISILAAGPSATAADDTGPVMAAPPTQLAQAAEVRLPRTGWRFPRTMGGLRFVKVHQYEQRAAGVSVTYNGLKIRTNIYIYNRNLGDIADGIGGGVVAEYRESRGQVTLAPLVDQRIERYGAPGGRTIAYRVAVFRKMRRTPSGEAYPFLESYLYITGFRRHFVKVRMTYVGLMSRQAAVRQAFMRELSRALLANR